MTDKEKRRLKVMLAGAGGLALGSASTYALIQALKDTETGRGFSDLPGASRMKYLLPAAVGLGVGVYGANYMRKKTKEKAMKKQAFLDSWVYNSLMR